MVVRFYSSHGNAVGGVSLYFNSSPQYYISSCNTSDTDFPTVLPSAKDKVWRITLTRTSGIRLVVHCNEVEVLNILMSDSTCSRSEWNTYWSKNIAKIRFSKQDNASDNYRCRPQAGS